MRALLSEYLTPHGIIEWETLSWSHDDMADPNASTTEYPSQEWKFGSLRELSDSVLLSLSRLESRVVALENYVTGADQPNQLAVDESIALSYPNPLDVRLAALERAAYGADYHLERAASITD